MNKSRELSIEIDHIGAQGDGVALSSDGPIYVSGALPGQSLDVAIIGRRGDGRVAEIVGEAKQGKAVPPTCRHFGVCGGCVAQHMPEEVYRHWKAEKVRTTLRRQNIEGIEFDDQWFSKPGTRRRVNLTAKLAGGRMLLGFSERRGNRIIDVTECPVAAPEIVSLLPDLRRLLAQTLRQKSAASVHILVCENGLDLSCNGEWELDLPARERLVAFAEAHDLARLSWGPSAEPIIQRRNPRISIDDYSLIPAPGAFLQATSPSQEFMLTIAKQTLAGAENIADLFAGVGTFALSLAAHAAVHGFEDDQQAVDAFIQARNKRNNPHPIDVSRRDLYRRPLDNSDLAGFDAVVIDPPRAGAREQFQVLAKSDVAKILSISCNPSTFARDARYLIDGGYELIGIWLIDQFLWSAEVEIMSLFRKTAVN